MQGKPRIPFTASFVLTAFAMFESEDTVATQTYYHPEFSKGKQFVVEASDGSDLAQLATFNAVLDYHIARGGWITGAALDPLTGSPFIAGFVKTEEAQHG